MNYKLMISVFLVFVYLGFSTLAQTMMPDYVIRTAQEINAIYGEGTIDINNTGWDWRGGSIGDNFPLTFDCTLPVFLPSTTSASEYYRVFFDTNFDGVDDWKVVVYSDYSFFGLCTAPQYECGTLPPRQTIGRRGHVDPEGLPNNLRPQPGESEQLIGEIPPSGAFDVLDGPRCASDISYWLVEYEGHQGWTAEGRGGEYYLLTGGLPAVITVNETPINPTPIFTPTAIPTFTCNGVTSRLSVGVTAQVTPGLPNNLRALPGESGDYLDEIPPGFPFEIVGGPECNSGLLWWQVNYQGTIGWTGEAGSSDDYWLVPLSLANAVPSISSANTGTLRSIASLVSRASGTPISVHINQRNEVIATGSNHQTVWTPIDPTVSLSSLVWNVRSERELPIKPLATRLDSGGQVVSLIPSPTNATQIRLEGGVFYDEFDLSRDNSTFDVGAFHPADGDMIVISQRGQGFIFVNSDPESPTYRQVSQAARVLLPNEIYTKLKFSANGQVMIGLTDANNLVVWRGLNENPDSWAVAYPILHDDDFQIQDFALSPDGNDLVIVGLRKLINAEDRVGFKSVYTLGATDTQARNLYFFLKDFPSFEVEFVPNQFLFAVASVPQTIEFFNPSAPRSLTTINAETSIREITFNTDGTLMAVASELGEITMWGIR